MSCHTWFFRPITKQEESAYYCEYSSFGYTDVDTPHDLFRISGYPCDKLFSLEDTLKFIENNKLIMSFNKNWEIKLKEFWFKNPTGLIEFG